MKIVSAIKYTDPLKINDIMLAEITVQFIRLWRPCVFRCILIWLLIVEMSFLSQSVWSSTVNYSMLVFGKQGNSKSGHSNSSLQQGQHYNVCLRPILIENNQPTHFCPIKLQGYIQKSLCCICFL